MHDPLRRHVFALLTVLAVIVGASAEAQPALNLPDGLAPRLIERLEQEIEKQGLVGLSAGVVMDGKVAGTLHFGHEDRENGIASSRDTMYRWASISKPLTAIVAMLAAEDGRLDLDADIRTYVPEFPEKPWTITARQLLTHQGGVVHYSNGPVIRTRREYDVANPYKDTILSLDTFKESPLVCEPGTKHSYTTHGYMLLAAVVERATNTPYAELVRKRIARPLGMSTLRPDYQWEDIPHRAVGYRTNRQGEAVQSTNTDVSWKLGGGGWISSVEDLARLAAGLMDDSIVPAPVRERMWTRQRTRDGAETGYGLGFTVGVLDGMRLVGHSGSQEKTRTNMLLCPELGAAIVLMSNSEHAELGVLTRDLLRAVVEATKAARDESQDTGTGDKQPLKQEA